jgi:hypothetical protein
MELSILDKEILEWLLSKIDEQKIPGRIPNIGVQMTLHHLETGYKILELPIHPNV